MISDILTRFLKILEKSTDFLGHHPANSSCQVWSSSVATILAGLLRESCCQERVLILRQSRHSRRMRLVQT